MRSSSLKLPCAFALLLLIGCGSNTSIVVVGASTPRPVLNMDRREIPLKLELGPAVEDDFVVPETATLLAVHMTHWRMSLSTGFRNAFGPFFSLAPSPGQEMTLLIDLVRPDFVPVAVSSRGAALVSTTQIQYRATLSDQNGHVLARTVGSVTARKLGVETWEDSNASAIEVMYEDIGNKLFATALRGEAKI